jgi:hypothetical protein
MNEHNIGWCIEAHDLAASKLTAFREKDTEFVRRLLIEEMIMSDRLLERLKVIKTYKELLERAIDWVKRTVKEL